MQLSMRHMYQSYFRYGRLGKNLLQFLDNYPVTYVALGITQMYVNTIYLFQAKATCFDQMLVTFRPLYNFVTRCFVHFGIPQCLHVDYLLAKAFQKSYNYRVIVICRLCLSMKPLKHKKFFLYGALRFSVLMLKHSLQITHSVVITLLERFS